MFAVCWILGRCIEDVGGRRSHSDASEKFTEAECAKTGSEPLMYLGAQRAFRGFLRSQLCCLR